MPPPNGHELLVLGNDSPAKFAIAYAKLVQLNVFTL